MENIEFNNQSQIILRDQVSSVLHGTSLNWAILSSDTDAIKKLKGRLKNPLPGKEAHLTMMVKLKSNYINS